MTLILAIFGVYRVSYMLTKETGPFAICKRWRDWAVLKAQDPAYGFNDQPRAWLIEGVHCPLCVSFWVAMVAALLIAPRRRAWPLYWFGIAGAVLALHKAVEK